MCERAFYLPPVETGGYKMVDVVTATPGGFAFPEKRRFCFGLRAWWGCLMNCNVEAFFWLCALSLGVGESADIGREVVVVTSSPIL